MNIQDNDYYIYLETGVDLSDPEFIRKFFSRWALEAARTAPQRWGRDDRLKQEIGDMSEFISSWGRPVPAFGRNSNPPSYHQIDWPIGLSHQQRRFPGSFVSYLSRKTKKVDLEEFVDLLLESFLPEYLVITKWSDAEARHFLPVMRFAEGKLASYGQRFQGGNISDYIPGIYWKTFFSEDLAKNIGLTKLTSNDLYAICCNLYKHNNNYIIDFDCSIEDFSEDHWRPCERQIELILQKEIFFTSFYRRDLVKNIY